MKVISLVVALTLDLPVQAQPAGAAPTPAPTAPNPAYAQVADVPGLPRVLLLGDSISIGYTVPVRERLQGKEEPAEVG